MPTCSQSVLASHVYMMGSWPLFVLVNGNVFSFFFLSFFLPHSFLLLLLLLLSRFVHSTNRYSLHHSIGRSLALWEREKTNKTNLSIYERLGQQDMDILLFFSVLFFFFCSSFFFSLCDWGGGVGCFGIGTDFINALDHLFHFTSIFILFHLY